MQSRSPGNAWLGLPALFPVCLASVMSLLAALVVVAGSPSTAAPGPSAKAPACAPVLLVGVEGPREKRASGATFSPVLMQVGQTFRDRATATGRAVELVRVVTGGGKVEKLVGNATTTKTTKAVTSATATAWASKVSKGQSRLGAALAAAAARCPSQQIVVAGYSQGATAVHRSLASLSATYGSRLMGAVLVSDGDRVRGTNASVVGAPAAPRRGRGVGTKVLGNTVDAPAASTGTPVISVCSKGDAVCDLRGNPAGTAVEVHRSYGAGPGAAAVAQAAGSMWTRVASWPRASVTTVSVPVGMPFSQQLTTDVDPGEAGTVKWTKISGPAWASLSPSGLLTGTAPSAGSWSFQYSVQNTSPASPVSYGTFTLLAADLKPLVSVGGQSTCDIREDTTLWCWGNGAYGQIGDGETTDRTNPKQIGAAGWADVSTSGATTCAIKLDQTLWCWGINHRGQLGIGNKTRQVVPVQVAPAQRFVKVATGWLNTCAIGADTSLWCWGDNARGQVGVGDATTRYYPTRVGSSTGWTSVSLGGFFACGTKVDGTGSCWGQNSFGQLGTGATANRNVPTAVTGGRLWSRIDAGWASTCGLTTAGEAYCWGLNDLGQLGSAGPTTSTPREVAGDRVWKSVSAGDSFACGVTTSSEADCWGSNRYGQLGNGQAMLRGATAKVSGTWDSVDAGWFSVCARPSYDGPTVCWGNNERGQLGRGDRVNRNTPNGTVASRTMPVRERRDPNQFVATSFNILGSQHTEPGGGVPEWAPGRLRSEWAANLIQKTNTGIMGFQEIQPDQIKTIDKIVGGRFDFWPGNRNGPRAAWQTVAWDSAKWEMVAAENVDLPVLGKTRPHPLVLLQNKETGKRTWLFNIHNSSKNTPERIKERRKALKQIVKVVNAKRKDGTPLVLLGDFNDRTEAFCTVVGKTDLKATIGGKASKKKCQPPKNMGIDWIFASKDMTPLSSTRDRNLMILRITDHPVLYSTLRFDD